MAGSAANMSRSNRCYTSRNTLPGIRALRCDPPQAPHTHTHVCTDHAQARPASRQVCFMWIMMYWITRDARKRQTSRGRHEYCSRNKALNFSCSRKYLVDRDVKAEIKILTLPTLIPVFYNIYHQKLLRLRIEIWSMIDRRRGTVIYESDVTRQSLCRLLTVWCSVS